MVSSAPTTQENRFGKSLAYFDYMNQEDQYNTPYNKEYADYEANDISRGIPKRKKVQNPIDSPIYYIRLPPQPYMYVSGLGYISEPVSPPHHMSQFLNLPVNFVANGKPSNIYQWNAAPDFQNTRPVNKPKPPPQVVPDSNVNRIPGQFVFNGKPNDIYVLRDSYNSLYGDALQNFYP